MIQLAVSDFVNFYASINGKQDLILINHILCQYQTLHILERNQRVEE